jgi:hypothetical protein
VIRVSLPARDLSGYASKWGQTRRVVEEFRCGIISAEGNLITVAIPNAPTLAATTDVNVPSSSSVAGATSVTLFIGLAEVFSPPLAMSSKVWNPRVRTASSEVRGSIGAALAVSLLWLIAPSANSLHKNHMQRL